jgi:hypothetical protein
MAQVWRFDGQTFAVEMSPLDQPLQREQQHNAFLVIGGGRGKGQGGGVEIALFQVFGRGGKGEGCEQGLSPFAGDVGRRYGRGNGMIGMQRKCDRGCERGRRKGAA